MDEFIRVPGTKFKFGLDPLLGLLPGIGDTGSALVSAFALIQAARLGVPKILLVRMSLNILINELVGIVPVIGDAFSFWFKSNARNYQIIKDHTAAPGCRFAQERLDFCYRGSRASRRDLFLRITRQLLVSSRDRKTAGGSLNPCAVGRLVGRRSAEPSNSSARQSLALPSWGLTEVTGGDRMNALSRFSITPRKRIETVGADALRQFALFSFIRGQGGDTLVFPPPQS